MAGVLEQDKEKFPNSRIGKNNFLSSVRDFKPEGVKLGIERVSKIFPSKQEPSKAQIMIEPCILEDMEEIRLYVLDDDGEYVTHKDTITGKDERDIVIESISKEDVMLFPMFLPCGKPKKMTNDATLTFYPTSSAYPLFRLALQNAGELPMDMGDKAFTTTQEELKDALEGFIFIAKCEEIRGKFNYMRMQVEMADL